MNVTLPNGKTIADIPEGTSKTEIMRKAVNAGLATYADFADKSDPMLDPTGGFAQNALAGAGKAFVDIGRGVSQRFGGMSAADVDKQRALDAPLMKTGGGITGNIVGNVAALAPASFIPGVNTMAGAGALGALSGLATPTGTGDSVIQNAAIGAGGGMLGQGVANTVGRIRRPVQSALEPSLAPLAQQAEQQGIRLNAAQKTGSKALGYLDSALDAMPFTGDKQAVLKGAQRSAWQKAVLGQLGENADEATPAVMNSARERIGAQFNEIAKRNIVEVGDDFVDVLAKAETKLTEFSPPSARAAIDKALNLAVKADKNGGTIPGELYQTVRSSVQKAADDAFANRNTDLARTLQAIREGLDDAAEASINPSDAADWMKARAQWKLLKRVEKAVDGASGAISPKKLFNEIGRKDVHAMKYGRGSQDVANLARIGKTFIAENLPNSGTAQRQMWQNLMGGGGAGALGLGVAGVIPPAALVGMAAGAATPLAAQKLLWGGNYLSRGLMPNLSPKVGGLLRGGAISAGAALPLLLNAGQQ